MALAGTLRSFHFVHSHGSSNLQRQYCCQLCKLCVRLRMTIPCGKACEVMQPLDSHRSSLAHHDGFVAKFSPSHVLVNSKTIFYVKNLALTDALAHQSKGPFLSIRFENSSPTIHYRQVDRGYDCENPAVSNNPGKIVQELTGFGRTPEHTRSHQ